ncbi:MAG: TonB-dependent receptor [Haliscomenobacteraceae bacterium CHB4]|nr:TonB-dependent receptor [Haliscomenobacteraceae bacterium CHB4]
MYKNIFFSAILLLLTDPLSAQNYTQTLKGTVLDKAVKTPLIGATVALISADPQRGAMTDVDGRFRLTDVPVGKHTLRITYLGYKEAVSANVTVNSGKETELIIEMEEDFLQAKEVVIRAGLEKQKPLNELSTVSARTFSVEETQRFAAAVNDPARMAASFAGVAMSNDGANFISVRGNSPNGLLWRMEGVDIPNPNHFSAVGSSGGGISILSAQLLTNSDFITGAFAAEYGNALSGVFDLKLRKGNSEKHEYTLQAGVLGLDAAAEGPFRFGKQTGSYLVNYRYSTLSVLSKLGVNIGDATTNFQDLSFNVWLPAGKAGVFTLFGMGGLSDQTQQSEADSLLWNDERDKQYDYNFVANTGVVGATHSLILNDKSYLKTVVAASGTKNGQRVDKLLEDYNPRREFDNDLVQTKLTVSSTLNHKFNARHFLRAGAYVNFLNFNFNQHEFDDDEDRLEEQLDESGRGTSINTFAQWQFRATERLTLNAGMHGLLFLLNNTWSVEPRASAKYAFSEKQSLSFGYGLHSQIQPLGTYFTRIAGDDGSFTQPNRSLDLTKAHHFVLSFDQSLAGNWHLKPEIYYQALTNVPVNSAEADAFSILNVTDGFVNESLKNTGAGRNYGLELTVEKFLTRGFYFLLASSIYQSEYRGSDGVWRNTRFNSNYVNTLTAGKEWEWNRGRKNRSIGVNLKITSMGGLRESPIDLEASRAKGETVRDDTRAFEDRMPAYFRLDTGVRLKRNYRSLTTTLAFDIQNATNRQNIFGRYYDEDSGKIEYYYQAPLIPVLSYKLEF